MTESHSAAFDVIPVQADGTETEIVDDEVLVYHPRQTRAVYLNVTAAVVWGLCDGRRSVREIIDAIGDAYPEAGAGLVDDVLMTVDRLRESGVLVVA
jgi:hypothetical protein